MYVFAHSYRYIIDFKLKPSFRVSKRISRVYIAHLTQLLAVAIFNNERLCEFVDNIQLALNVALKVSSRLFILENHAIR